MWWKLKRVIAPSKEPSVKSSAVASPSGKLTLAIPSSRALRSASSTIAGVRSTPVTVPTLAASARETTPGPQATSIHRAASEPSSAPDGPMTAT